MRYLSWASFYEGASDGPYYDVLLPRIIEEMILADGNRVITVPEAPAVKLGAFGREVEKVAREICENAEAFNIVFIHSDTGGRGLQRHLASRSNAFCEAANALCNWPMGRCILITPKHETEAWMLADPAAVMSAFGYSGKIDNLNLPANAREAEALRDPKAVLEEAHSIVRGRRRSIGMLQALPTIARFQSLALLRASQSFQEFEAALRSALMDVGCLPRR